jgi:hypothetical protein
VLNQNREAIHDVAGPRVPRHITPLIAISDMRDILYLFWDPPAGDRYPARTHVNVTPQMHSGANQAEIRRLTKTTELNGGSVEYRSAVSRFIDFPE